MTWLVWRRHRVFFLVAVGAAVLVVVGRAVEPQGPNFLVRLLVEAGMLLMPLMIGGFAGITLAGPGDTHVLTLTQHTGRRRWWAIHLGFGIAFTALAAAAATAVLQLTNAPVGEVFAPPRFDESGYVPVVYAVLAVVIAATAGLLTRTTIATVVVTVVGYLAIELLLVEFVRPYYLPPIVEFAPILPDGEVVGQQPLTQQDWYVSGNWVDAAGHAVPDEAVFGPGSACAPPESGSDCISRAGVVGLSKVYQPVERYWPFQLIESVILLVISAGIAVAGLVRLRRADIV